MTELWKKILIDNDYKTIYGSVRSACSSSKILRGQLKNDNEDEKKCKAPT